MDHLEQIDQTLALVWDIILNRHTWIALKLKLNPTRSLSNLKIIFWHSLTHVRLWFPLSSKNADTSFSLHSELRYAFLFSLSTLGWSCASLASSQWKSTFFTKLWERRDATCWELKSWSKPWTRIETATSIPKNSQTQVRWGVCSQTIMPRSWHTQTSVNIQTVTGPLYPLHIFTFITEVHGGTWQAALQQCVSERRGRLCANESSSHYLLASSVVKVTWLMVW